MKHTLLLFVTAMIWGSAFVAQSVAAELIGPFTMMGVRTLLGGCFLLPVIWLLDRRRPPQQRRPLLPRRDKKLWLGGLLCGLLLASAGTLQQYGIQTVPAGKCGFITAIYVILVPVFSLFLGRRYRWPTWLGVLIALGGLYLLCISGRLTVARGDVMVFLCAVLFAVHILVIDHFSPLVDGVRLSCIQFFVCSAVCLAAMFLFEQPHWTALLAAWKPIVYAGVLSCGVAYTLQIVCQSRVEPVIASLILSLESVFSVLFGWLILREVLSPRELAGCALVFAAIILVELAPSYHRKQPRPGEKSI